MTEVDAVIRMAFKRYTAVGFYAHPYNIGDAPLPQVAKDYEDAFRDVIRQGRCNYAPMSRAGTCRSSKRT